MTIKEVIQNFYHGLAQKNDAWQENLSENIHFSDASKKLQAEGKPAFIQSFNRFLQGLEKVQLKELIIEGSDACAVVGYDYISPKGNRLHQEDAEVWKVVEGNIVELRIYFDITEYRSFMAG